jgi:hypothetical protein
MLYPLCDVTGLADLIQSATLNGKKSLMGR